MPEDGPIRVLLADDHALLREGLRRSLVSEGYDVIAEAGDGQQAIQLAEQHQPDVVLMDVTMPVLGGIEAARRLTSNGVSTKIVMLTMHADPQLIREAQDAGASGYLMKDCTTRDIVETIKATLSGETRFPTVNQPDVASGPSDRQVITAREAEVLQLIADGKSTVEAAAELYVSVKTVKNHLASAYSKLDAHDRTQAVLRAARLGLITLND